MKYNFEKYTVTLDQEVFYLPSEFIDSIAGEMFYVLGHHEGMVTISDSGYINRVVEEIHQKEPEERQRVYRVLYSNLLAVEDVNEIVNILTTGNFYFNYGDKVTVESGKYAIAIKKAE